MYNWKEDKRLVKLFDNDSLLVKVKDMSLVREGMETTFSGGVVTRVGCKEGGMWEVLKERSRRLPVPVNSIAKISLLELTFRNYPKGQGSMLLKYRRNCKDLHWGSCLYVLNPSVLERTFFGTYSTNMDFLTNLYVFLLKNPKYEGVNTYEIVRLTLQKRIGQCQDTSRATKHQADQVGWEPISTKPNKGGLKLGELHLYGLATGPKHLEHAYRRRFVF